jgi:Tat protein translocase TatB subunit
MLLFILDSLGTSELLLILAVALIFFGPRKLPQISRQIGKSLAEFRRASEDFKRTWEREVSLENAQSQSETPESRLPTDESIMAATIERAQPVHSVSTEAGSPTPIETAAESTSIANQTPDGSRASGSAHLEPTRKQNWL